jgi:hypothetical protein
MLNLSLLTETIPQDIINLIKEYILTPRIRLQLFYEKHKFDENKLKKMLTKFTSEQLEQINWKYLYYKIYLTSPPFYDNNNLVPILKKIPNIKKLSYKTVFDDDTQLYQINEPSLIYDTESPLWNYRLQNISRSDYYQPNAQSEKAKKKQQFNNIINSWGSIHRGQDTSKIKEIDEYFQDLEFELIKTIILLDKILS